MQQQNNTHKWLPTSVKEIKILGWETPDVILFSGDAYVDHPAFGTSVIGRVLENSGYRVAIVPQPNWKDDLRDFKKLGAPKLFFGVSSGNMDSMVNHYTANKRKRSDDAYTPGNRSGFRPDNAVIVYSNIIKSIYPEVPLIIGGVEASLRRFTHYDYWSDSLKTSILIDSKADMLVYGMGEKAIVDIANHLNKGIHISKLRELVQTGYYLQNNIVSENNSTNNSIKLHSHDNCLKSKRKFAENFRIIEEESNKLHSTRLIQPMKKGYIIINPSGSPASESELDKIYDLPFTRLPHPRYSNKDRIPAFDMIKDSVNIHRGCFGGCSFCTISAHQGKFISSRSESSIMKELDIIIKMPGFKGYISDLGGPSANMYKMAPKDLKICFRCKKASCIYPEICKNILINHRPLIKLYKKARRLNGIKKVFIGSGIRYDLFLKKNSKTETDQYNKEYYYELIKHHVSGRLKVAPEHTSENVLTIMRKPSFQLLIEFNKIFDKINKEKNLNQQIVPYFISSHPGCTNSDMAELAVMTKKLRINPEQIQDFTPTPMTLATVMYYTGLNPYTLKKIYIARTREDKLSQRKYFFWYKKEHKNKIINELKSTGRKDLINKLYY